MAVPLAFNAIGAGSVLTTASGTPVTFSDTAVAGADVFLVIENTTTIARRGRWQSTVFRPRPRRGFSSWP